MRSCNPWLVKPDWETVDIGAKWPARTSAVAVAAIAFSSASKHLMVSFGRQFWQGNQVAWTFHLAECSLRSTSRPTVADVDSQVNELAVAPDGDWAASSTIDNHGVVYRFNKLGADPSARIRIREPRLGGLIFAPDGHALAAVAGRKAMLIKPDLTTRIAVLDGHHGQVNGLAFHPIAGGY